MLQIFSFDANQLKEFTAFQGNYCGREAVAFEPAHCTAGFAEWSQAQQPKSPWHFWNDELLYIIEGELEFECQFPRLFNGARKVAVRSGDLVLVKTGMALLPKVLCKEPVRVLWIAMPSPRFFGIESFWKQVI